MGERFVVSLKNKGEGSKHYLFSAASLSNLKSD